MSRDHYVRLCDVTADTEITSSSIVACWAVFTELLPGNVFIISVILYMGFIPIAVISKIIVSVTITWSFQDTSSGTFRFLIIRSSTHPQIIKPCKHVCSTLYEYRSRKYEMPSKSPDMFRVLTQCSVCGRHVCLNVCGRVGEREPLPSLPSPQRYNSVQLSPESLAE
jgi:hypothetical protein